MLSNRRAKLQLRKLFHFKLQKKLAARLTHFHYSKFLTSDAYSHQHIVFNYSNCTSNMSSLLSLFWEGLDHFDMLRLIYFDLMGVHYKIRGAMMSLIEVTVFSFWVANEISLLASVCMPPITSIMLFDFDFPCYDELEFKIEATFCILMAQFQFWVVYRIKSFSLSLSMQRCDNRRLLFLYKFITLRSVNNDVLRNFELRCNICSCQIFLK